MTNPPTKKTTQKNFVNTNLRLPPDLHETIRTSAEKNGRSANAEIIARLQQNDTASILAELADVKTMLRKVLDQI